MERYRDDPDLSSGLCGGRLAIAVVEGVTSAGIVELDALQGLAAQRFSQLEQEAEILSGSVIGFLLLAAAAFLNVWAYPGWARTLMICGAASLVTAVGAWRSAESSIRRRLGWQEGPVGNLVAGWTGMRSNQLAADGGLSDHEAAAAEAGR